MNKIYCSNCGKAVSATSKYCMYCGAPQHGVESSAFRFADPVVDTSHFNEKLKKTPPTVEYIERQHLGADSVMYFFIKYWAMSFIVFVLLLIGAIFQPFPFIPIMIGYFSVIILIATMVYNNFTFEIDEHGLSIEQGIIHKKQVSLPYEQIQNVNIERSIIDRLLGLSHISIETAGNSVGDKAEAYIPGIHMDLAIKIHDLLIDGADGQVGEHGAHHHHTIHRS